MNDVLASPAPGQGSQLDYGPPMQPIGSAVVGLDGSCTVGMHALWSGMVCVTQPPQGWTSARIGLTGPARAIRRVGVVHPIRRMWLSGIQFEVLDYLREQGERSCLGVTEALVCYRQPQVLSALSRLAQLGHARLRKDGRRSFYSITEHELGKEPS